MKSKFGTLFRRKDREGWYINYSVDGKRKRQSLGAIDKAEAEKIFTALSEQLAAAVVTGSVDHVIDNFVELMEPGTKAKKEAEEKIKLYREEQARLDGRIPITLLFDFFIEHRKRPPSQSTMKDYKGYSNHLTRFIKTDYPDINYLEELSIDIVNNFEKSIDHLSPSSFNKIINTLRHLVKILRKSNKYPLLTVNIFDHIEYKRLITTSKRALSEAEIMTLIKNAEADLKLLIMLGTFTGLRMGDCSTLDWSAISMSKQHITIIPSKTAKFQKKTVVPLHAALFNELNNIPLEERMGYVLKEVGPLYESKGGIKKVSTLVSDHFVECGIKPKSHKKVKKSRNADTGEFETSKPLDKETARPFKNRISRVGFHSLRHSFISLSAEGGGDLVAIQKLTAHSSPQIQQIYLSASEQQAQSAINALPSFGLIEGNEEVKPIKTIENNGLSQEKIIQLVQLMDESNWQNIKQMILS